MPEFYGAGDAFSGTLSDILAQKKKDARQAMLDAMEQKNQSAALALRAEQLRSAQDARQSMEDERQQRILDAMQKDVGSELALHDPSEQLQDELIDRAKKAHMEGWLQSQQVGVPNPQGETEGTLDLQTQTHRRMTPDEVQAQKMQKIVSDPRFQKDPKSMLGDMIPILGPKEAPAIIKDIMANPAGYNLQRDTVLYKGKPTDVLIDPRGNGKVILPTADGPLDITGQTAHYEKPQTPDRVLVQTDQGYRLRSDVAKELQGGGSVELPETATTRTMQEGATRLEPHIPDVMTMGQELDKRGLFGPIMSRVRDAAAKVGTIDPWGDPDKTQRQMETIGDLLKETPATGTSDDQLIGEFTTTLGLLASGAGRVHGGARGGGSPQMISYMKDLLSSSSTYDMFVGRARALDKFMLGYAKKRGAADPSGLRVAPPTTGPANIQDLRKQYGY